MAAAGWLVFLALRSTLVLAAALGLERLLRRKPAAGRHVLLTLAAVGLLLMPALSLLLPRWELEMLPRWLEPSSPAVQLSGGEPAAPQPSAAREAEPSNAATLPNATPTPAAPSAPERPSRIPSFASLLLAAWLVGVAAAVGRLARALRSEGSLRSTTRPLAGAWLDTAAEASRALGLSRTVPLLTSDAIETPLTSRWPTPAILLPLAAEGWSDERRRVVVQHELVHLARGDAWRLLAWRVVGAVYWFHPLARLAERHARLVGEQACDEAVLQLGTRPSTYARHLMEIAESLRPEPRRLAAALPMVERGQLERRLLMILDANRSAGRGRTAAAIGLAVLAATVVAVSVIAPLQVAAKAQKPVTAAMKAAPVGTATASLEAGATPPSDLSSRASGDDNYEEYSDDGHGDFTMQRSLGDGGRLRVHVDGPVRFDEKDGSIRELGPGSSVEVKTRTGGRSQRMTITPAAGGPRYEWWVNGESRPVDDAARAWLKDALQVVAASREIGSIQGQVGSLQGEIGEVQGQIGSLQGEIGAIQGEIGGLQGKLGELQGEQGSLQGEIGSHQGAIGGLEAARSQASSGLAAQLEREIETHEAAIRKLEAELESGNLSRRMKDAEAELEREEKKSEREIKELESKIEALQGDQKIGKLEKQIEDIHADERIREIEKRTQPALDRLKAASRQLGN
jgi:beta-lactamase regulating signal transducer with metallopeptidase domain/predicted  nucleic acid-binding Zn-ribbon protein